MRAQNAVDVVSYHRSCELTQIDFVLKQKRNFSTYINVTVEVKNVLKRNDVIDE